MIGHLLRALSRKRRIRALQRDLDERLALRKAMRPQRSKAAHKGWETRRTR